MTDTLVSYSVKELIYAATGLVLACICTGLQKSKLIQKLLKYTNHKSINDDIFDDIIDYVQPTDMHIYLKASDIYYTGRFYSREEKGLDSWIVLINYCSIDKKTGTIICDSYSGSEKPKSSVAINLGNVERIELFYSDNSKIWKNI